MKINISEKKVLGLIISYDLDIEDIAENERAFFLANNGNALLLHHFNQNNSSQLEKLLNYQDIEDLFIKEVRNFNKLANINYIEKLPENSFVTNFIWYMSKQNALDKKDFFNKIYPLVIKYRDDFKQFFNIRLGESASGFPNGQPIGMFFLRVFDRDIDSLLESGVISLDLFSPSTKDTLAHNLHQYSFEVNKSIIDKVKNHELFFKDKNNTNHTGLEKLINDLRERNIQTIEYLFSEKLDLNIYKNEFISYIIKSSNIFKNQQTRKAIKDNLYSSLNTLFNLTQLQSNLSFKKVIAEKIANNGSTEIHYLWLNAKLPAKGIEEKKPKI